MDSLPRPINEDSKHMVVFASSALGAELTPFARPGFRAPSTRSTRDIVRMRRVPCGGWECPGAKSLGGFTLGKYFKWGHKRSSQDLYDLTLDGWNEGCSKT